jgi:hypothetical protein
MAAAKAAVPEASPAEEDREGIEGTVAASAGRMLSRVLLLALTKWVFPSMRAKDTQEASRCSAEANACKSNHTPEQHSVSPSSATRARNKRQAATGLRGQRKSSATRHDGGSSGIMLITSIGR